MHIGNIKARIMERPKTIDIRFPIIQIIIVRLQIIIGIQKFLLIVFLLCIILPLLQKILISPSQMFFPVVVASIIAPTPLTARNQGLGRLIYLVVAIPISTAYLSIKGFLGSMEKVCLVIAVVFPMIYCLR